MNAVNISTKSSKQRKQISKKEAHDLHLEQLLLFDYLMLKQASLRRTYRTIIGIDDVGRGCLAGPVVACAIQLPVIELGSELAIKLAQLNDSKLLSPNQREEIASVLAKVSKFAIASATVGEIDKINILHASLLAMKRAVVLLQASQEVLILVDGNQKIPAITGKQITIVKGDGKSAAVAAASVIAKVVRDSFMRDIAMCYPHYKWHLNKGYGSYEHRQAIQHYGVTPWHRRSFNLGILE